MIVVHFIAFWLDKNTEYSHESEVKVSIDPNCGLYLRSMNLTETEREREREKLDRSASKLCSYIGNLLFLVTTDAVLWLCQHTLRNACSLCDSLLWSGHHNLFFSWSRKVCSMLTSMLTAVLASRHGQWCIWTLHRGYQQVFQKCSSLHKGQDPSVYMTDGHVHTSGAVHKYLCELSSVSVGSGAEEQLQAKMAPCSQL